MNMIEKRKAMAGQGGFTLIELLVVIAILAVLGGAAIIGIGAMRSNSEIQVCKTDKETIELAKEAERVATSDTSYATISVCDKPTGGSSFYAQVSCFTGRISASRNSESLANFTDTTSRVGWEFASVLTAIEVGATAAVARETRPAEPARSA